jgi:hypothetical protein
MAYKLLSVSTYDFENDAKERVSGGKIICYDNEAPKNQPLPVVTLSVDVTLANQVLQQVQKYPVDIELSGYLTAKGKFAVTDIKPL